jgi:hypothetical protein
MSITFDLCDLEHTWLWDCLENVRVDEDADQYPGYFDSLPPSERHELIHEWAVEVMTEGVWSYKAYQAAKFQLDYLHVDVRRSYCPFGCHRLAEPAARYLKSSDRDADFHRDHGNEEPRRAE